MKFGASIASVDPHTLFDQISVWSEFQAELPFDVGVGHDDIDPRQWRSIRDATNPTGGIALWDEFKKQISIVPHRDLVSFAIPDGFERAGQALARISPLDFYLVALGCVYPDAWAPNDGYERWGFARRHISHGWGCLFRGTGHDRLVSRRWLDFGPWRTVHLPNDTTFIQFHDLSITDPDEAYAQAKPGHQRLGVAPIGGYIQTIDTDEFSKLEGIYYFEESKLLEVVIPSRFEVSQPQMLVTCALRLHHRLTNQRDGRIERIAYVFFDRRDAELHLHELWLRDLECWYLDEHGKHRLDLDYHPTPQPPPWVANLAAHPANDLLDIVSF